MRKINSWPARHWTRSSRRSAQIRLHPISRSSNCAWNTAPPSASRRCPKGPQSRRLSAGGEIAEWTRAPGVSADRVFLFIHGGGYIRGAVAANRATAALISAATGATTLSIGYRLAPENPFPAAVDDVYGAYRWLLGQNIDPKRIVVGGISAGGGLTLSLLLKLKDHGRSDVRRRRAHERLDRLDPIGTKLRRERCLGPVPEQDVSRRHGRLLSKRSRSPNPARLSPLRRTRRLASAPDPSRHRRGLA